MLKTFFSPFGKLQRGTYLKLTLLSTLLYPSLGLGLYYLVVTGFFLSGLAQLGVTLGLVTLGLMVFLYFTTIASLSSKRLRDCALSPYIALAAFIPVLTLPLVLFLMIYPTDFAKKTIKL